MQTSIFPLVSTLLLAAACGGSGATRVADAGTDVDAAAAAPTLAVSVSPLTIAAGASVTLTVEVEHFEIVNPMTTPGVEPGQGHFHYQIDTAATYTAAWTSSVTIPIGVGTSAGDHTIDVWLVNGNHVDIDPPTHRPVTVTVE